MTIFQASILGIIQGLTEFIPISSSGHLVLIPKIIGWEEQSTSFDIVVHAATTLALILYFRRELSDILRNVRKRRTQKLLKNILITTIPAGIIGILFEDTIDSIFKDVYIIVIMLISLGCIMFFIDSIFYKNHQKIESLTKKQSFFIGIFQSFAFIRGTSRSGITIIGGMLSGLSREQSVRYTFLAGIPILAAVSLKQIVSFSLDGFNGMDPLNAFTGFTSAFISGFIAIQFLISYLKNNSLKVFGAYRIILGLLILILL